MYCGTCGKELRDGARFCDHCGAVQPEPVIPESQQTKKDTTPVQPIQPVLKTAEKPQKPNKPKKKVPKALIAGICLVLVIAIAAALVLPRLFPGNETIYVLTEETHYNSEGVAFRHITYEYDDTGMLLSRKVDDGEWNEIWDEEYLVYRYEVQKYDGSVEYYEEYQYDEFGNVLEKNTDEYDNYAIEYTFNDAGLIESYVYQGKPSKSSAGSGVTMAPAEYICEYDDKGNLLGVYVDTVDGKRPCQAYEYDEEGRLVMETIYDKEWTRRNVYNYGDDSLEVEAYRAVTLMYGQDPDEQEFHLYASVKYEFDEEGRLLEETHRNENGEKGICYEYSYDDDGFPEEMTADFGDGADYKSIEYTCDEFGNIIELEEEDGTRIEYEYIALEVTAEQAAHYRRWEGIRRYEANVFYDYHSEHLYHLIPNPVWEIKMPICP